MNPPALGGKVPADAELALAVAYFLQRGPDENTGPATEFIAGIGGQNTVANQQNLDKMVRLRKRGFLLPERINLGRVVQEIMGWDSIRTAVALAEAEAAGWLTAVNRVVN